MKPTILMLHGALGSDRQFDHLIPALEETVNVFTLNFEGHGGRPSDRPFNMDHFTENLIHFLNEKGLDHTHIFGYSMGGYVALNTAIKHPDRIARIATLGTKFDWTPESAARELRMLNPDKILEKVPHFAERLGAIHHPLDWKDVMVRTGEMMTGLGDGKRLTANDLDSIDHRVMITIGDLDEMVSVEESAWAAERLPNGTLKVLEAVRHPIEKLPPGIAKAIVTELLEL